MNIQCVHVCASFKSKKTYSMLITNINLLIVFNQAKTYDDYSALYNSGPSSLNYLSLRIYKNV